MKKVVLFVCCLLVLAASAQNGFTTYTTNLSISGAIKFQKALLVDNSGNKWIGFQTVGGSTNAGLVKYDNVNWTLYNQTSSPAFPSKNVTSLAKDNVGNIWIGCDSGLVKFDGVTFTTYSTNQGLPSKLVNCVEAVGNQIYVGTNEGLSRFDGTSFTNYTFGGSQVKSIKSETQNILWLGVNSQLIEFNINSSYTSTSYTSYPTIGGNVSCVYIDMQNNKWISTMSGIFKFNGSSFINANTIFDIFGSMIPDGVKDIETGPHGGLIFIHQNYSGSNSHLRSGLTELALNGKVYQYFSGNPTQIFGNYFEMDNGKILVSDIGTNLPIVYYSLNPSTYLAPYGIVSVDNFKTLDINNVKAGISNRSDMHWDMGGTTMPMYQVPKGSVHNSNFATALWIGGLDAGNQLHGGAQTYRQSGVDFWPGPLDTINATIDTATSLNYDKIWKVSYTDINNFITAFNSGSIVATPDMLSWPAHGNGNNSRNLAPFVDHNHDGIYNPNDGDYPKIKGEQALYFIYNDNLAAHSSSFSSMGIEVQAMAYAYGCNDALSGRPELDLTTFYDYKIINRSSNNYHDVYIGMWSDVDLGYYLDDYIGSNVKDNYAYAYNADTYDECVGAVCGYGTYMPAQGFKILKSPLATSDGIDNDYDGTTDEADEMLGMTHLTYFSYVWPGTPLGLTNPQIAQEYYNYMSGFWKDGTPFTCGINGYGGTTNTNWVYPGDPNGTMSTDPANTCGNWTEGSAGNTPADRRLILSTGPFTLNAGEMQEVEYAFVTSFDSSSATNAHLLSVAKLKTDMQKITQFYNLQNKPNCLNWMVGLEEKNVSVDFSVYPNPATSSVMVAINQIGIKKINYEVLDVLGKTLIQKTENTERFTVDVSNLTSGIYFLRLTIGNSLVVKKIVKD